MNCPSKGLFLERTNKIYHTEIAESTKFFNPKKRAGVRMRKGARVPRRKGTKKNLSHTETQRTQRKNTLDRINRIDPDWTPHRGPGSTGQAGSERYESSVSKRHVEDPRKSKQARLLWLTLSPPHGFGCPGTRAIALRCPLKRYPVLLAAKKLPANYDYGVRRIENEIR